jgi:hypothetical protein
MMMIDQVIQNLVSNPTEENKQQYFQFVNQQEYSLLENAHTFPPKSWESFNKRKEAFAFRRNCASMLLNSWVATRGSIDLCPVSYTDTLIIPFQQIKVPK